MAVDSVPLLDIAGTLTPDSAAFLLAGSGVRLSSGVIAIGDVFDAAVRFFDPSGRPIRKVGRQGEGPGEFQHVGWIGRCAADSVFVWDGLQNRMTVIDSAGRIARTFQLPSVPAMVRCSSRGTFAVPMMPRNMRRPDPEGKSPRYTSELWLLDAQGDTIRSLGEIPFGENRPLGRVTRMAMADDRLYVGTADSAFVGVYGLDGRRLATLATGIPARAPTRRNYEQVIDALVRAFPNRDYRESVKRYMLDIPMPDLMPPYTELYADPAGTLWVETSVPGDPGTQLRAIAPDGRILGDVRLPVELEVFEVGRDYILGAYEDEGGEQHVALYRLRRGE